MSSLVEDLSFESSSYNFTLAENRPEGTIVGLVNAFPGNDINTVNYTLVGHTDMFSINAHGAITANKALDKESQEWYILEVEAFDNRVPPTSATTMVRSIIFLWYHFVKRRMTGLVYKTIYQQTKKKMG